MKINFKEIKVYDLSGKELLPVPCHEHTANALIHQATASPIKNMELARMIYTQGEIELLPEQIMAIKNAVTNSVMIADIAKEAILKALE